MKRNMLRVALGAVALMAWATMLACGGGKGTNAGANVGTDTSVARSAQTPLVLTATIDDGGTASAASVGGAVASIGKQLYSGSAGKGDIVNPFATVDYGNTDYSAGEKFRWQMDDMINVAFSKNFQDEAEPRYLVRFKVVELINSDLTAKFAEVATGSRHPDFDPEDTYQVYASYPSDMIILTAGGAPVAKGKYCDDPISRYDPNEGDYGGYKNYDCFNYLIGEGDEPGLAVFTDAIMPDVIYHSEPLATGAGTSAVVDFKDEENMVEPMYMSAYAGGASAKSFNLNFKHLTSLVRWTVKNATPDPLVITSLDLSSYGSAPYDKSFGELVKARVGSLPALGLDITSSYETTTIDTGACQEDDGSDCLTIPPYEKVDFYRPFVANGDGYRNGHIYLNVNIAENDANAAGTASRLLSVGPGFDLKIEKFEPGKRYFFNIKIGDAKAGAVVGSVNYALGGATEQPTAQFAMYNGNEWIVPSGGTLEVSELESIEVWDEGYVSGRQCVWKLPRLVDGVVTTVTTDPTSCGDRLNLGQLPAGTYTVKLQVQSRFKESGEEDYAWSDWATGTIHVKVTPTLTVHSFKPGDVRVEAHAEPGKTLSLVVEGQYGSYDGSYAQATLGNLVETGTGTGVYTYTGNGLVDNYAYLPADNYVLYLMDSSTTLASVTARFQSIYVMMLSNGSPNHSKVYATASNPANYVASKSNQSYPYGFICIVAEGTAGNLYARIGSKTLPAYTSGQTYCAMYAPNDAHISPTHEIRLGSLQDWTTDLTYDVTLVDDNDKPYLRRIDTTLQSTWGYFTVGP
ncbi:MAG: hypothetical protein LBT74_10705 [Acidobacteriota bacterium]|jgi:hypothetical protein|nr:hypothetical protein [Acidobacteriota bacterium]